LPDSNKIICCFGELLLRFSPQMQAVFINEPSMPVYVGGAELNVATALAKWEVPVKYLTALPDNYLSKEIIDWLSKKNIDTSDIIFCGERIGIYYLPQGADLKHNAVIYDRNHSSFASLVPGQIDWEKVFENVSWLHLSAISPALNANAAEVCVEAVKAAAKKNITISIDLNYRAKLWQYGKPPFEIMPAIVEHCDVVMGNVWSAESLLGIKVGDDFSHECATQETYLQQANKTAAEIMQRFPKCKMVANTFRFDEGAGIRYFATLKNKSGSFNSAIYSTQNIVDKVGSGDCFMGGLIYGIYNNNSAQDIINYAAAAAFSKLNIKGDATSSSVEDIKKIIISHG
jgi:2-dehydro-3-deoxygluconokinase